MRQLNSKPSVRARLRQAFAFKGINPVRIPYRDHWIATARGAALCACIILTLLFFLFATIYIFRGHAETERNHFASLPAFAIRTWPLTLSAITAGGLAGFLSSISQGILRFSGAFALITIPPAGVYAVKFSPLEFAPDGHANVLIAAVIGATCALVLPRFVARLKSSDKTGTMP